MDMRVWIYDNNLGSEFITKSLKLTQVIHFVSIMYIFTEIFSAFYFYLSKSERVSPLIPRIQFNPQRAFEQMGR